ncbi:unnamed protein product [Lactuca saligna]|uniref:Uncharacterized protein n=1 Tax=Lactuca saligna TaxID=75948 RepID=A0AA35ZAV0_LACSI|nr:unnamed protein product [Lactuca saligna]
MLLSIDPTNFDLIAVGTGLSESIIATVASAAGKTVLHRMKKMSKNFFSIVKASDRVVCHFYLENWPCKVGFDELGGSDDFSTKELEERLGKDDSMDDIGDIPILLECNCEFQFYWNGIMNSNSVGITEVDA